MSDFQNMELTLGRGRGYKKLVVTGKFADFRDVTECEGFPHCYHLRGSDMDCGSPASVEEGIVWVNFCGKLFTKEPIPMSPDGDSLPIRDWWFVD
jgi:hypothetical protein